MGVLPGQKKSGRNNEVVVRRGSTVVYSVANYRPHLGHFWANVIVISRTEFNASRLLNIKTTAGTIFQPRIFLFLNPFLPEFSYP